MSLFASLLALTSEPGPRSDAALTNGISSGDREAFRLLFDRYHVDLHRFLVRTGVPLEAAEDILQDVFVGLWQGRSKLDASRSIRAYLYRSCRNRAANHFRNRSRMAGPPDDALATDLPAQDEQLAHALLHDRLEQAVSRLPERQRAVFELCFINGLSYKEAALALDITPKTVENHMGYALKSVRQHLAPYADRV